MNLSRICRCVLLFCAVLGGCGGGGSAPAGVAAPAPAPAPAPSPAPAPGSVSGLDFPSNGDSPASAFVAFQFLDPQNRGLPMWGPGGAGVTYLWKYRPRQQAGYYATFWWSNNGRFEWNNGVPDSYYGAHPYPRGGGTGTIAHDWEIAGMDDGADNITTLAGAAKPLVVDRWYSQALRVSSNGDGTRTARFYIDLPSTAGGDVIAVTSRAGFGDALPPAPALSFGDSPWYADYQHERLSGVLRGIKVIASSLSDTDLLAEAASDTLATAAGRSRVWYMNINPTPDDISDKSGAGHDPVWADSTARASLWTP